MKTAYSTKDLSAAVADLKAQCGPSSPRAVICFGSVRYDPAALSRELSMAFPDACVVGCSTAGELASGKMTQDSVVAMFLDADVVEAAAFAVVRDLRTGAGVADALHELEMSFGMPLGEMSPEKHVGLVLIDGLSLAEERVIEEIGDRTDLFFVGGSAGDDLKFRNTQVFAGGKAWSDAALLVLLKVRNGFDVLKTQSFVGTGKTLVATKVDRPNRKVLEFNGQPAAAAYAQLLGVSVDKLPEQFMRSPLGLMIDGEPYVRSPQRVEDGAIVFYCQILEGAELELLANGDIVADTRAALHGKLAQLGHISGIVDFNCILRTLELRAEKRTAEYAAVFDGVPAIGFSTYGEAYLGHLNQTSTMLLLR